MRRLLLPLLLALSFVHAQRMPEPVAKVCDSKMGYAKVMDVPPLDAFALTADGRSFKPCGVHMYVFQNDMDYNAGKHALESYIQAIYKTLGAVGYRDASNVMKPAFTLHSSDSLYAFVGRSVTVVMLTIEEYSQDFGGYAWTVAFYPVTKN